MRHRKKFNHLGRKSADRKAMLSNMASSLIINKRIRTTVPKAKALRIYVEPLINRTKQDTTHSRRMVFRYLQRKEVVTELFRDIAAKVVDRPGGYTRILKLGNRLGDNASMCLIELVDYNENMLKDFTTTTKRRMRRRRGRAKKKTESGDTHLMQEEKSDKQEENKTSDATPQKEEPKKDTLEVGKENKIEGESGEASIAKKSDKEK